MPWQPSAPGERPTLGWLVLDWITEYLARPEIQTYEPLVLTREQAEFVLRFYELDPVTCTRLVRRGVLSRPRGWGKSPISAALACVEALASVVPAGWDADGRPVGRPWSDIRRPLVEIAAVSEPQVDTNTWAPLTEMLSHDRIVNAYPGLEPLKTYVALPYGRVQKRTAESGSAKGAPAHFVVCDQTEEWTPGNGGVRLYKTLKNNVNKRGGHMLETPNAYTDGMASVAENTMTAYRLMVEGKAKLETGVYYDHREAPDTDQGDDESLLAGLAIAYGDSADLPHCAIHQPPCESPGWVDLRHIAASMQEPDADPLHNASDFLNQIGHTGDALLSGPVWRGAFAEDKTIFDRDTIVLGFDGSRGRAKGKPDATALIACRVNDGFLTELGANGSVWEAGSNQSHDPENPNPPKRVGCDCWKCWEPPIAEIESLLAYTFTTYRVVGFYADPGKDWRSHVNAWEAKYGQKVDDSGGVKVSAAHPFEWWMTGGRAALVERAIQSFEGAVRNKDLSHSGSATLTRHVLNARRRLSHSKLALGKENDYSPKKIDAAVAAVLAYQARLDALSRVTEPTGDGFYLPSRLY